ncbi:Phosphoserine phosphatase RsbP [bacterium HR09]|nr:Phosphoserine phosphatase RsbP [bacterium HR09]
MAAKQAVSLKELASLLHEHFATLWAEHQFATAFFFALREDGTVRALGAGHTPAVVVGLDGQTRLLYPQGPPLGLVPNPRFEEDVLVLRKGELLVVATDGIVEASNPAGEEYGLARLRELVAACANAPLGELATRVLAGVREFTQGEAMSDDFTLVAVRRTV